MDNFGQQTGREGIKETQAEGDYDPVTLVGERQRATGGDCRAARDPERAPEGYGRGEKSSETYRHLFGIGRLAPWQCFTPMHDAVR